jgi:DNA helicase-2/ATP-dependent DNA helicase PcrA
LKEISPLLLDFEGYYTLKNTIDQTRKTPSPSAKRISKEQALRTKKRTTLTKQNKNDLNKGDKVHHKVFGDGVVVSVASEQCVIAFKAPHGIKTLLKDHPAINKL